MAVSEAQGSGSPVDVAAFIDRQPVGVFQLKLLLTCAAVLFLDGFDTQAIGYVAPAVAREWGLTKGALGPVFSAGLFGLMIGALLFGPLADRIGRKKIIIFSTAALGTIVPESDATPMSQVATKGAFRTIVSLYLSLTATWSSVGHRELQSDFSMRSNENLTSADVSSPRSLLHIRPGFRVNEM